MTVEPTALQVIFEVRYERGYRYLDRCGDVMVILESILNAETKEIWLPAEMKPTGAKMKCPGLDVSIAFDTNRLAIEQNPIGVPFDFPLVANIVLATIRSKFDINELIRYGYRFITMLGTDSIEDAKELSLRKAPTNSWPLEPPIDLVPTEIDCTVSYENKDRTKGIRLEVGPAHKLDAPLEVDPRLHVPPRMLPSGQREALLAQNQRRAARARDPIAGLTIDVDYYHLRPLGSTGPKDFLLEADSFVKKVVADVVKARMK
jgi:hypothetical protein